ncbi:MAG: nucleotidyltransferase domain-containing protein [Bacteroidetes bacterium]|nr:nucleotidyltransferase domain-containing protein [Bacteroidota bacterium]MBU1718532.1 nucleotidyltransferase domain-containing protein [Bacteroidota bacterium]
MSKQEKIFRLIKNSVSITDPNAILIVYGSYARGDNTETSDIDLLVLLEQDVVNRTDQKRIKYPLYDIEFSTGIIISPLVFSKKIWETVHCKTPFYENVTREGKVL